MVVSLIIFTGIVTAFFTIVRTYRADEDAAVKSTYTKQAVTSYPEELDTTEKVLISGTTVLTEAVSYPEGTFIKINGTTLSQLTVTSTDMDHISYAKKYGTELLENYISPQGKYKKELALDNDGQVVGVTYTFVY